jgi:VanZ family protein
VTFARTAAAAAVERSRRRIRWLESIRRWRVVVLAVVTTLALILGTIVTFLDLQRYALPGRPVLDNADFGAGFRGWQVEGLVTQDETEAGAVRLQNRNPETPAFLRRTIELPPGRTSLRLAIDVATAGVTPGDEAWKAARVYLVQKTADDRYDWNQPHMLALLTGTTSRQRYEGIFEMPGSVSRAMLGIELAYATGSMRIADLELTRLEELPVFRLAASILVAGWSLLGLWVVEQVYRSIRSSAIRRWLLPAAGALAAGLFMPSLLRQALIDGLGRGLGLELTNPDALGHGLVFGLLALLLRCGRSRDPLGLHLACWLLLAMATEVVQLFTPDRDPEFGDWLVDAIGASLGLLIAELGLRLQRRLRPLELHPKRPAR